MPQIEKKTFVRAVPEPQKKHSKTAVVALHVVRASSAMLFVHVVGTYMLCIDKLKLRVKQLEPKQKSIDLKAEEGGIVAQK